MKRTSKHRGVFERPQGSGVWWIREKIGLYQTAVHIYRKRKVEIREGRFVPEDIRRKQASVAELIADRLETAKTLRSYRTEKQRLTWWEDRLGHRAARSIIANDIEQARLELLAHQQRLIDIWLRLRQHSRLQFATRKRIPIQSRRSAF